MTYDPKSPSNLLPPFLRFMCRALGLVCFVSWILSALGLVVLILVVGASFVGLVEQPQGLGVTGIMLLFTIPLAGLVFGLRSADWFFVALRRGDYFHPATAKALRNFALGMVVYFLTPPVIMLLLVAANVAKVENFPRFENFGFKLNVLPGMGGIDGVLLAVFLGAIVLFASIWERAAALAEDARRLADENAQFV